jgi:hypothetical protein
MHQTTKTITEADNESHNLIRLLKQTKNLIT